MVGLKIADIRIRIDMPREFLYDNFFDFLIEDNEETWDFVWKVEYKSNYQIPSFTDITGSASELRKLSASKDGEHIVYEFYEENAIPDMIIATDKCKKAVFLLDDRYINPNEEDLERIRICLFNTFREVFFLGIGFLGMYTLHSASVLVDGRAYLFSTFSGGGKSTHSNMWIDLFDAKALDGDVAVLSMDTEGKLYAFGLPWCGTSDLYMNECALVDGIAFIEQEKYNEIEEINNDEAALDLFFNCFTPMITEQLVDEMIRFVEGVLDKTTVFRLKCLPDTDAAKLSYGKMVRKEQ